MDTSEHARALASIGAAKGGRARAQALSSTEREEIARHAAEARWGIEAIPKATHTGQLRIVDRIISCAVLENGKRLLTQGTFMTAIGRAEKAKAGTGSARLTQGGGLPPFLAENLRPYVSDELLELTSPIVFRSQNGRKAYGYEARLLPLVCDVYLKARDEKKLLPSQESIARVCDLLTRKLAQVAIIALVDEATGYQEQRARNELQEILAAYVLEEHRPWITTFPNEFFEQIYRLHGWPYQPGRAQRTPFIGKLINEWIYAEMPPPVLPELQVRNPKNANGHRSHKHHQFLTPEMGREQLQRQITAVTTIMRISDDKDDFERHFAKLSRKPQQQRLPLVIDEGVIEGQVL